MITDVVDKREWNDMKVRRKCSKVSHMMFADDLILFRKSIIQQITCITKVPRNLCEASSQRVSVDKSRILFSKNTHMHISNQIVQVSGLKETKELGMYLWEPLTRLHPRVKRYQYLVDKVRVKLTSWKGK